jgi:hypothetical protein
MVSFVAPFVLSVVSQKRIQSSCSCVSFWKRNEQMMQIDYILYFCVVSLPRRKERVVEKIPMKRGGMVFFSMERAPFFFVSQTD